MYRQRQDKESCLVRNSSTLKWKCFTYTPTKHTIDYPNPNSWKFSRTLWYGCGWCLLEPLHESMEVNSAQLNIIAGPSHNAVLSPNKISAQDILAISTPQLPPKRIRAEKWCWKCFKPECDDSKTKRYYKNQCDDCNRKYCDERGSR